MAQSRTLSYEEFLNILSLRSTAQQNHAPSATVGLSRNIEMVESQNADSTEAAPMTVEEENLFFYGHDGLEDCYNNGESDTKEEERTVHETGSEQANQTEAQQSIYTINLDGRYIELSCPAGMDVKVGLPWMGSISCVEFNHQQGHH
ncbi:hypothetical protein IFR05_015189 [Cadophora sp. M221]|nr:hypothetical protein IFR05_015189 [Cadophora sp. M221]